MKKCIVSSTFFELKIFLVLFLGLFRNFQPSRFLIKSSELKILTLTLNNYDRKSDKVNKYQYFCFRALNQDSAPLKVYK